MKPIKPAKVALISFHHMQQGMFNYIHFAFRGDLQKQGILRDAWRRALAHLENHFQSKNQLEWIWSKFHLDSNRHVPFKNNPVLSRFYNLQFPGSGNFHTLNVAKM
jgi:acyl-homoserine lactone acylase PvdQ